MRDAAPLAQLSTARTLAELLVERAAEPRRVAVQFGADAAGHGYDELLMMSRRAAGLLRRHGVGAGDRVIVMLPTGLDFVATFFGCQLLGAVPVPVVPPWSLARLEGHLDRIGRVARVADPIATVTSAAVAALCGKRRAETGRAIAIDDLAREPELAGVAPPIDPDAPAFIQFTSGSTADPRGAVISQRAALENARGIAIAGQFRADDIECAWLPLFHDMGLIGHLINPFVAGLPTILLAPEDFARQPVSWLRAIARARATLSTAPNFAYQIAAERIPDRELRGLDLSSWRIALCGGEPIQAETVRAFARRFAPYGLSATAFFAVYGLAEMTLAATFPTPCAATRVDAVQREALERDGRAVAPEAGGVDPIGELVSVGRPLPGHDVRVVDAAGAPLAERRVGEIELRGPSMMTGYFRDPEATARVMRDGWLRTGDLGYLADGDLFVVGRRKEVIIVRGRNLAPYDVEAAAASAGGVRKGRIAAVGIPDPGRGTEALVVVCETRVARSRERMTIIATVRRAVLEHTGVTPDRVILAAPGTIAKTSSGKIQRGLVRARVIAGEVDESAPGWWARLVGAVARRASVGA